MSSNLPLEHLTQHKKETTFLITKEYRRFEEFCHACLRESYIGICYGQPGVGKTLSARYYARWDLLEPRLPRHVEYLPLPSEIADCRTLFYTPAVATSLRKLDEDLAEIKCMFNRFVWEAGRKPEDPPLAISSDSPEPDYVKLIIVDEADRLNMNTIEHLRDLYDRHGVGLVLIGMPGIEKRLARYPQLYSRIGFAHEFRTLSDDEMLFILRHHWVQLGLTLESSDFTDMEAVSAIVRITRGNFRLLHRLFTQIRRIIDVNVLTTVTREVVEAARECLVIGDAP